MKPVDTFAAVPFEKFRPTPENPYPDLRLFDFLTLGPFVLETDGAFETEYLYEREKTLNEDYLACEGGEAKHLPALGKTVRNRYYGKPRLVWREGYRKWGSLRFDREEESCDDALFATEQRNCCYYAAAFVDCERAENAVICYENSGCLLYVNGVLADTRPYGRCKGLSSVGAAVAVRFRAGRNVLLFKLRTGYICDSIDLSMSRCTVWTAAAGTDGVFVTPPQPTGIFQTEPEGETQIFRCFAANCGETAAQVCLRYGCGGFARTQALGSIATGKAVAVRLQVPAEATQRSLSLSLQIESDGQSGAADCFVTTAPVPACTGTAYRFAGFHFDTTYHQEQRTYAMGAFWIAAEMCKKLRDDPAFKAVLSEVDYLHPFISLYPEYREIVKNAFREGRAEADCFYNQPNELTSSGEAFVRNLIYGQLYHRDVLGRIAPVYAPGDVFGHPNQLSQICMKGGCRAVSWGKFVLGLDRVFQHMSPDGTVAVHDKGCGRADAQRLGLRHFTDGGDAVPSVPGFTADGDTTWMQRTRDKAHYAVCSEMLDGICADIAAAEKTGERRVDLTSRDMTQHHAGVLLTRTDFKQANRLAENLLVTAEKFSAIAALYGAQYPEAALDKAWRQLLCAQHHDSVTGTNNEISFVDLMIQYREACELAAHATGHALRFLASGIRDAEEGRQVAVFNPHFFPRRDVCRADLPDGCALCDEEGDELPVVNGRFLAEVPSFGYRTYTIRPASVQTVRTDDGTTIENEFFRLTVSPEQGGGIVSLYDKENRKQVLRNGADGPGNRIAVLREVPDRMETQHEFYTTGQKLFSDEYRASVVRTVSMNAQTLTIETRLGIIAQVRQTITLYPGIRRIDMQTVVADYRDRDDLFTVTFPLDIEGAVPVFDDRFAPHVWAESKDKLSFQTHQYASFSHAKIAPCNQWFAYGVTIPVLLPDGSRNIGMTAIVRNNALRTETDILLAALTKRAVPVTPYSDRRQPGSGRLVHFNEDLDNTDTRFVLCVQGIENEYADALLRRTRGCADAFRERIARDGTAVLYLRDSENLYKKPVDVFLLAAQSRAQLAAFLSAIAETLADGGALPLDAICADTPGKAETYGVALFNRGNIACSCERGGLLSMMLFHTADFYGNAGKTTGDRQLIPENKTHSFSYALYPHAGDFTAARVYENAQAFNDPLLAVTAFPTGKPCLPQVHSFASVDDGFTVTAFKAGGNPSAALRQAPAFAARGFTLRGFGTGRRETAVCLKTSFALASAASADLLEENAQPLPVADNTCRFSVKPHSIETVTLRPQELPAPIGTATPGAPAEPVQPVYIRSWEYDLGSMPAGYLAVCGTLGRRVEALGETQLCLPVTMVNNRTDAPARGVMHLQLPAGFRADKTVFPYSLAAGEAVETSVLVTKPAPDASGTLYLRYTDGGQSFYDVFPCGCHTPSVALRLVPEGLLATVTNDTPDAVEGLLAPATPFETWAVGGLNPECRAEVSPSAVKVSLEAGETGSYLFRVAEWDDGILNAYWAVVKLMVNGRIRFAFAEKRGERHNYWAHTLADTLFGEDGGSIERLLRI